MPEFEIGPLDLGIFFGYLLATRLLFGWYAARRAGGGSEGYFLAGRKLTWPLIGLSFYVSNMSGSTFVGLPGSGYQNGIAVYAYEWMPALILVLFVFFILPFYYNARVSTAPEFLQRRFSTRTRIVFSVFLLCANLFIDAAAALYAGGTVVRALYPELPLWLPIAGAALLAGVYIFFGGLTAVVINDVVQAVVIMLGGVAIAWLAWTEIPSWAAVQAANPPAALELIQPADDAFMPWPGMFTGVLVVGLYFWCMNQFMIQRALGARSLDHARWGALFAGLLKLPNLFILILPGVMATVLYPELTNPDFAFPVLAFDLLPVGVRGVLLAALAAAILSSLESILNSAATLFTLDLVKSRWTDLDDRALVRIGRIATLGFMAVAAAWAPRIADFPTLWQYLQSILSYVTPPVVVVFLAGIFWPRANRRGAELTLLLGVPAGILAWWANEILVLVQIQYLYASGVMLLASLGLMVLASLSAPAPAAAQRAGLMWTPRYWRQEQQALRGTAWYRDYRLQASGLLLLTALIVAAWW
jgi:SSS family solute:Na+ symporter